MKKQLLLILALLSVVTPAYSANKSEKWESDLCVAENAEKVFSIHSKDGKNNHSFKVPLRYMAYKLEREGAVENQITLDAMLDNLKPRCDENRKFGKKEDALTVQLRAYNNRPVSRINAWYNSPMYLTTELAKYPSLKIKLSKNRPSAVPEGSGLYGYVVAYPKDSSGMPKDFSLQCGLLQDMETFGVCRLTFVHRGLVIVESTFDSSRLDELKSIEERSVELVKKFWVKE